MAFYPGIQKTKELLWLLRESLFLSPFKNIKSILGEGKSLRPPYPWYSEYTIFQIKDRQSIKKLLRFLADMTLLWYKSPEKPTPDAAPAQNQADLIHDHDQLATAEKWVGTEAPAAFSTPEGKTFPGESWSYVNGIITDATIARLNGKYLAKLFGRQIQVLHNPTDTMVFDMLETVISRVWGSYSRADEFVYAHIIHQLINPTLQRVVVIAHSQGTVILSDVIKKLQETHLDLLYKLEVYTMANCAKNMCKKTDSLGRAVPYLEHFANTQDIVCRLGVLARQAKLRGEVHIDGPIFLRNAFGHLLNAHYLSAVEHQEFKNKKIKSRLYMYLNGNKPHDLF